MKVVIVDYGLGNLVSIYNTLKKIGATAIISGDRNVISKAEKLILPGVGQFQKGIDNIKNSGFHDLLNELVLDKKIPILGICLGAQLFCKYSEEGGSEGLGWIDADVLKFRIEDKLRFKIPHIGWNTTKIRTLMKDDYYINLEKLDNPEFYFVHSYNINCKNTEDVWMTSQYEYEFVSAVKKNNIIGTQFHPEKSYENGVELLKQFLLI